MKATKTIKTKTATKTATKTEASPVTMTYEQAVKLKFTLEQMKALGIEFPKIKAKSDAPVIKVTTFKGQKIIGFYKSHADEYALISFGANKAKLLLENIEAIKKFVAENE